MKIAIGADHGGYEMKESIRKILEQRDVEVEDLGCYNTDSVDYPDYAIDVARKITERAADDGMLVCTTGIGMTMAANKIAGVRAALCVSPDMAKMARVHNNANVLVFGAKTTPYDLVEPIIDAWLANSFESGGRHERRVAKINALD